MNIILAGIFSWPCGIGVVIGLCLDRVWRYAYAGWLNHYRPLPGGRKRRPSRFNFAALGSVLAVAVVAYSLVQVQTTAHRTDVIINDARTFAVQVQECQKRLIEAISVNRALAAENDELSQIQRTALADWLHDLLFPPQVVIDLGRQGPVYNKWALDLTEHYYGIIAVAQHKQDDNNRERAAHPLPEPTCGR